MLLSVVLLAAVLGMCVAFLVWLHRDRPGAGPLAAFVVAASFWAVAHGLELAVPDIDTMRWLFQVQLTLSVVVPVAWFVTVIEYSGRPEWLTRRRLALLLVEPGVFVTLVWSNPGHRLIWDGGTTTLLGGTSALVPEWTLLYWGHLVYILALILAGGVLLIQSMLRANESFRGQIVALLLAITAPTVAHALYVLDTVPTEFDPTSLGYVVSGIVLSAALLRGQLLDVAPVTRDLGREAVFAEMDDQVIIVDEAGRLVDVNDAAAALFDRDRNEIQGQRLAELVPALAATVPDAGESAQAETELQHDGAVNYYDVRVTPLYRAYGVVSGHLVSLRNVTDRRQREQRIDVLNRLLRHNIRNEMNVVRGNADLLVGEVDDDARDRIERIRETVDTVVDRSNKIGRVSEALEDESVRPVRLASVLTPLVERARETYPEADISLTCDDDVWVSAAPSLSIAFEELVDNAVEHGGPAAENPGPGTTPATGRTDGGSAGVHVDIDVGYRAEPPRVCATVADDGPGIDAHEREVIQAGEETPLQHGSGVGLWLVAWVVRSVGGTLSFKDGPGTTVAVGLPAAKPPEAVD
ncbi:histidine kinase N-terminal 7TM domain-containing protein [Halomicroarcula sp. GCM10025709]|uniref:histidine kinase N-terminal 7TM domain-containing protein n=1 Tax=Haloarcula TaxID=2237 RepID=UPI0024C22AA3|nr:histidine kinase N-terminal 7TM domain-containing protein [Halomicroarcula sp. YJ-61-S]